MDLAYNPHAERARRKNRSSTNINHLTLAPLTTKIPLNSDDDVAALDAAAGQLAAPKRSSSSYLQGKSAPTTPRLLSRSPAGPRSRSHHRTPSAPGASVSKSKSTTHLAAPNNHGGGRKHHGASATTPKRRSRDDPLDARDRSDSDWLLRTGAVMSTEAREYKGQSWLVSRQSSTSLAAMRDDDEEAFENQLAHERELAASRHQSRRGSAAAAAGLEDGGSLNGSRFASRVHSRVHSRAHSRVHSRSHSMVGRRSAFLSPMEYASEGDSYFPSHEGGISGPDFVNLDEKLEELEQDTSQDDEAAVRRLVRHEQSVGSSWITSVIGWSLFSVEENEDDSSDEEEEDGSLGDGASQVGRGGWSSRHFEGVSNGPDESVPPPRKDEGAWGDAAWLLSVATKVMF